MPPDVDPTNFQLALILTAAGATVAATLIASVIEILKRLPGFGAWLDAGREAGAAVLLSAVLVGYAYLTTTPVPDAASGFAAFLAFVGIAGLAGRAYDVTATIKASASG